MKNKLDFILFGAVFGVLSLNANDVRLWDEDPQEFVRRETGIEMNVWSLLGRGSQEFIRMETGIENASSPLGRGSPGVRKKGNWYRDECVFASGTMIPRSS